MDPLGHVVTSLYYADGQLRATVNAIGCRTTYQYDRVNRQTAVTNALGETSQSVYYADGLLAVSLDPLGHRTTYTYDGAHRRTSVVDAAGHATAFTYYADGELWERIDALAGLTTYAYDAANRQQLVINPLGQRTTTLYNADSTVLATADPLGHITSYLYDGAKRSTLTKDSLGHDTLLSYWPDGTLHTHTQPGPRTTTYVYDTVQRPTQVTDPLGHTTVTRYTANGLVEAVQAPTGDVTTNSYDAADRLTVQMNPLGRLTSFAYDAADRRIRVHSPHTGITTIEYDCLDRPIAVTDAVGCQRSTHYDAGGRLIAEVDGLGHRTTYSYDVLGHRTAVLDAAGHVTATHYDALGRPRAQVDAEGRITTSVYDAAGRVLAVVNPRGNATSFSYDGAGRKVTETDPLGRVTTFTYDAVGNLTRRDNARGQVVTYTYSANRELTGEQYPGGRRHTYTYDDAGQRTRIVDATGVTTLVYDNRNLLESVTHPDGPTITYRYNALRQRTGMTDPQDGLTTYTYDDADRLVGLTNPQGKRTTLAYDAKGRRVRIEHGNGSLTTHVYDCADRVTRIEHRQSAGTLLQLTTYTYDPVGQRTRAGESSGVVTTWTYDATYQLTREWRSGGSPSFDVTYTYDAAGNRLTQVASGAVTTYTYDAANELLTSTDASGVTTYTYDAEGNRTCQDGPSETIYYAWDEDSQLTVVEPPAGKTTLTYSGDGQRVRKETPTATTKFRHDGHRLLEETDGEDALQRQYTSTLDQWGDLVSEYDGSDTAYHLGDALGSTDALLDDDEAATDRYQYRAFGAASQQGTHPSPCTFVGAQHYYHESDLELYYAGARYYDPAAGRWLSEDPLGLAAGDVNLYRYVRNNPVNKADPSGLGDRAQSIDFQRYPETMMRDLIGRHLANKSTDGEYVVVVDVVGDEVKYFIFEEWYNRPSQMASAFGMYIPSEQFSPLFAYRLMKVGTVGKTSAIGDATAVERFITNHRTQEHTDRYASLGAGMSQAERQEAFARTLSITLGTVEVVGSLLPGGASTIHAIKGEWEEFTISVAGDAAYLLSGPLAKAAEARKAFRLAKAAHYGSATIQAGIGAERFVEGVYELRKQDGDNWAAGIYIGEAVLRMFGATTSVIRGIKAPRAESVARQPAAAPDSKTSTAAEHSVAPNKTGRGNQAAFADEAEQIVSDATGIPRNPHGAGQQTIPGTGPGGVRVPDLKVRGPQGSVRLRGSVVEVKASRGTHFGDMSERSRDQIRDSVDYVRGLREKASLVNDAQTKQLLRNARVEVFTDLPAPKSGEFARLIEQGLVEWKLIPR